jgi:predicted O-linked N-acetylglucosamine transferase (SPINDLY family)
VECGLPEAGFVFCCFNAAWKITRPVFDIWMRLLTQVEGSVLWLLDGPHAGNLRREAQARGMDAARLAFAPRIEPAPHLARHGLADLFLDTWPYGAHTTGSDALWAGLPVLTCMGGNFPARVGASLLTNMGMPELIARTPEDYETLALELARDPAGLAALRGKLARNRTTAPLFDSADFARAVESVFESLIA